MHFSHLLIYGLCGSQQSLLQAPADCQAEHIHRRRQYASCGRARTCGSATTVRTAWVLVNTLLSASATWWPAADLPECIVHMSLGRSRLRRQDLQAAQRELKYYYMAA